MLRRSGTDRHLNGGFIGKELQTLPGNFSSDGELNVDEDHITGVSSYSGSGTQEDPYTAELVNPPYTAAFGGSPFYMIGTSNGKCYYSITINNPSSGDKVLVRHNKAQSYYANGTPQYWETVDQPAITSGTVIGSDIPYQYDIDTSNGLIISDIGVEVSKITDSSTVTATVNYFYFIPDTVSTADKGIWLIGASKPNAKIKRLNFVV